MFHRIIKKNQNKNFVKKINHKYLGGSDVMNVSMDMGSPVKAVKSFVYEKNPAFHYFQNLEARKKAGKVRLKIELKAACLLTYRYLI